jgi:hypothetical protein
MSSLSSAALAQQIATAVSGDRGLNAPIFTDDLVRYVFLNSSVLIVKGSYF